MLRTDVYSCFPQLNSTHNRWMRTGVSRQQQPKQSSLLPIILRAFPVAGRDLVQGRWAIETTIYHHPGNLVRIADVIERVLVQHDEVGELADFERAEVLVEAELARG